MKRLNNLCLVGLLFVSAASAARGESIEWTRQLGASSRDVSFGVSADCLGNVYFSGYTNGSLGGPSAGNIDAFVSKYDAAGNFQWSRQLGTDDPDDSYGVSADGLGNVYISGRTNGSLGGPNAGGGATRLSVSTMRPASSSGRGSWERRRTIAAACRPTGWATSTSRASPSAVWAGQPREPGCVCQQVRCGWHIPVVAAIGNQFGDTSFGVSADGLGNVYISGETNGSLGGPHAGRLDAFVSKYDAAGTLQWTRQLGTSADDPSFGVSADGLGNVYISGATDGSLGGPNAGGPPDAFVSKYDAAGNLQWTRQLGTSSLDVSHGVSADGLGNVYISGDTQAAWAGQLPASTMRLSASTMRTATPVDAAIGNQFA